MRLLQLLLCCGIALSLPPMAFCLRPRNVTVETRACQPPHDHYPFCDTTLSIDDRVNDLVSRIDLSDKGPLLTARGWPQGNISQALQHLGVPGFDWGENSLHGNQVQCLEDWSGKWRCPTTYPMPNALGATFNRTLWLTMGAAIGKELRALWLQGDTEASEWSGRALIGLDTWSPTINQPRDPRWGRFQEVPSEDPLVLSEYAVEYTTGAQQGEDSRFLQTITTLKHWDAYSLEDSGGFTRHSFNANVSKYDMQDTYFVPFKAAVTRAHAKGVMCSYNAVNGIPTCAHPFLNYTLRGAWGFDGYVTSDTGAVQDIYKEHKYTATPEAAVCAALAQGSCDIDSGSVYWKYAASAVTNGTCKEEVLNAALRHTLKLRFELGLFDPIEDQPYWHVPADVIGSEASQQLSLEASQQSIVLLKNENGLLPLPRNKHIAVIGPHANASAALLGSYLGQVCPGSNVNDFSCVQSVHQAIAAANTQGTTTLVQGCSVTGTSTAGFNDAVSAAKQADILVVALGNDQTVEAEAHDRTALTLPGVQSKLLSVLAATGKPIVLVLFNGGPLAVEEEVRLSDGVLEAFYPGIYGAQALADVLFGAVSPSGRLPYTMYYANYTEEIAMTDMCMSCTPGRSYRYYNGSVLFPFTFGLSYSELSYSWWVPPSGAPLPAGSNGSTIFTVYATNDGPMDVDTVVTLFMRPLETALPGLPLQQRLLDFQRLHVPVGATAAYNFTVGTHSFYVADHDGNILSVPGTWEVFSVDGTGSSIFSYYVFMSGETTVIERFPEMPKPPMAWNLSGDGASKDAGSSGAGFRPQH